MKIRTQIIISIIISVVVISGIGTLLFSNYQQLAVADTNEQLADEIVMGSYDLVNLQNDYILHNSDRARFQWEEKYATLQNVFPKIRITDPVQQETLNSILECNQQLKEQFSKIAGSQEAIGLPGGAPADPELVQIRWNRLAIQTQGMVFDASRLSEMVKADVLRIQQENNRLVIILVSVLLLVILLNYFIVNRQILRSLESLQKGTGIIGSGNFDYTLDDSSKDELGDLSRAFNRMTVNLKTVTASKTELEKEIADRKRAEEELKAKNNDLEAAYEEITSTEEELRQNYQELEKSQLAVRESEERFRALFEEALDGICLADAKTGIIIDCNQALVDLVGRGRAELIGQPQSILHPPHNDDSSFTPTFSQHLADKKGQILETQVLTKTGVLREVDIKANLLNIQGQKIMQGIFRDITERKRAEVELKNYSEKLETMVTERTRELRDAQDQLVKKERLAVLGKLAGGVGHELRNPLGAIKNAAYFLNMALEKPDPDVKEMVELINKEVARSEDIISSLLDFARPKTLTLRRTSVNTLINEALKRNPVPHNVAAINNSDETLPEIQVDPDKLLQVFNNIISNAFQAMPEEGKLIITSKQSGPEWISIAFADTGVGISSENMKRLFEPLFTTKIKGIGLGMVVTKTIVESHGGHLDVQSEEGRGTTFTVNLPISGRKAD